MAWGGTHSSWRVRRGTALLAAVLAVAALLPTGRATAFPNDVDADCHYFSSGSSFQFAGTWPSSARSEVSEGILSWNGVLGLRGGAVHTWKEDTGGTVWYLYYEDLGTSVNGRTTCAHHEIRLSSRLPLDEIAGVARHEAGHAMALQHSGKYDSFGLDGLVTMMTCSTSLDRINRNRTQDDVASLSFIHGRLDDGSSAITVNYAFEQGLGWWGVSDATAAHQTTGGATGPGHITFTPANPATSYLFQTEAYADAPAKALIAAINHKRTNVFDSGTAKAEIWARQVVYGTTANCSLSEWPNGKNMNDATTVGSFTRRVSSQSATTSEWTLSTTSSWLTLPDGDQDVQLRVFADPRTILGQTTSVRLDNLRVQCDLSQTEGDCL